MNVEMCTVIPIFFRKVPGRAGKVVWCLNWLKNPNVRYTHCGVMIRSRVDAPFFAHYTDRGVQFIKLNQQGDILKKLFGSYTMSNYEAYVPLDSIEQACNALAGVRAHLTWWHALGWFFNRKLFYCHSFVELMLRRSAAKLYTCDALYDSLELLQSETSNILQGISRRPISRESRLPDYTE